MDVFTALKGSHSDFYLFTINRFVTTGRRALYATSWFSVPYCYACWYRLFGVYKTRHFLDFLIYYW